MPLSNAERARRYRERVKMDPVKYEAFKEKNLQRLKNKIKRVANMTESEHERMRKYWRERKKKQNQREKRNQQLKLEENGKKKAATPAERQKRYRERLKMDPLKYETFKEKNLQRLKSKLRRVANMTENEHERMRKYWREGKRKQHQREKRNQQLNLEENGKKKAATPAERQKRYRERLKMDTSKYELLKIKERLKKNMYAKKNANKKIADMTESEQENLRESWRARKRNQRQKQNGKQHWEENKNGSETEQSQTNNRRGKRNRRPVKKYKDFVQTEKLFSAGDPIKEEIEDYLEVDEEAHDFGSLFLKTITDSLDANAGTTTYMADTTDESAETTFTSIEPVEIQLTNTTSDPLTVPPEVVPEIKEGLEYISKIITVWNKCRKDDEPCESECCSCEKCRQLQEFKEREKRLKACIEKLNEDLACKDKCLKQLRVKARKMRKILLELKDLMKNCDECLIEEC